MKRQIASFACAVSLVWLAFFVTTPIATGQAAAEYRTRAGDAKPWPKDAVRGGPPVPGAHALLMDQREVGATAAAHLLGRGHRSIGVIVPTDRALDLFSLPRLAGVERARGPRGPGDATDLRRHRRARRQEPSQHP